MRPIGTVLKNLQQAGWMRRGILTLNKILLVEDDMEISTMLKNFLETENFEVVTAFDGESACSKFLSDTFSLVLLDLMIPKMSGMEVMARIRESHTVPIIILSAKDTDSDKTLGLGLGADDYITKPFSVTEVAARIKANIRRSTQYSAGSEPTGQILKKGGLVMDLNGYSVMKDGSRIELTSKEFEILKLLLQNPRKVYTKEQIYSLVWNDAYLGDENAVNVHISRLRNKIEDTPRKPQYVVTVWGIGYKLGDVRDE
jgi:DNA-binding response OmpR family regulator